MLVKKMQALFVKVVSRVEENNAPFTKFLHLFSAILYAMIP